MACLGCQVTPGNWVTAGAVGALGAGVTCETKGFGLFGASAGLGILPEVWSRRVGRGAPSGREDTGWLVRPEEARWVSCLEHESAGLVTVTGLLCSTGPASYGAAGPAPPAFL